MPYDAAQNAPMVAAFCEELHAQGISHRRIEAEEVFAA